jgi:ABC-type nitrate/sulfonate/bicarbonate transport system ATPase subunit
VAHYIETVGLNGFEEAYPNQLSGGMRQRVAIARALVYRPSVLLMDEPFGALDAQTRSVMQELLLRVWEQTHKTVLFVTHDIDEAVLLSDRVYVMTARPGQIKAEVKITLPRPRDVAVIDTPAFIALRQRIHGLIREEIQLVVGAEAARRGGD